MTNEKRLFYGSCFALITTALSFSLRAGILPQIQAELGITVEQIGQINSMWFFGFPISMVIGGLIYHTVGGKAIMNFAFIAHTVGIVMTVFAGSFIGLMISTFFIGLGNGCTEAACNPMIADTYEGNKMSKMMNRFHMWFPGGIVIGSLTSLLMTNLGASWQMQIWLIMIPTVIYAVLFWQSSWPKAPRAQETNLGINIKAMATPLFIFMMVCMWFTAQTEFAPTQFIEYFLKSSGATPMLILALITGTMAIARYFGGEAVHRFKTTGVLLVSAILATLGLFLFTQVSGPAVYGVAIVFALGVAYFWPNMIGFIADYIPNSSAIGMSVVGAVGMLSSFWMQPIIGRWYDNNLTAAKDEGLAGDAIEAFAGQATLGTIMWFPVLLIGLFTILHFWVKDKKTDSHTKVAAREAVTSVS